MSTEVKKENAALSYFKAMGQEIAKHPHSAVRGLSAGLGVFGAIYAMDQMDVFVNNAWYMLPGLVGLPTYSMHKKKEEKIAAVKEAYPKKILRNFCNTAMQYTVTGINYAAGIVGAGAAILSEISAEIADTLGVNAVHTELSALGAIAMPIILIGMKFADNRLFANNENELKTAQRFIAMKNPPQPA